MEQEAPRRIPVDDIDRERYLDHSFDLVTRVRAAREAAQREMEAFGDVSEYEIRKIYGQRTDITYHDVDQKEDGQKPSSHGDREVVSVQGQSGDTPRSDGSQATFDFKAEDATSQPRREEE
jgi:hypothetical protein